jgi:hypothetical protein
MLEALGIQPFSLNTQASVAAVVKGAIGVADGARVLAPILLEPELELA